jgi:hypothetical protein
MNNSEVAEQIRSYQHQYGRTLMPCRPRAAS